MAAILTPAELRPVAIADLDASFSKSGVYFLYAGGVVVYVGQSCDVLRRIGEHLGSRKTFDAVAFIPTIAANRLWLEGLYIAHFKPRYNASEKRRDGRRSRQRHRNRHRSMAKAA